MREKERKRERAKKIRSIQNERSHSFSLLIATEMNLNMIFHRHVFGWICLRRCDLWRLMWLATKLLWHLIYIYKNMGFCGNKRRMTLKIKFHMNLTHHEKKKQTHRSAERNWQSEKQRMKINEMPFVVLNVGNLVFFFFRETERPREKNGK